MREEFQGTELYLEDPREVTALGELDFEDDEVTELVELGASSGAPAVEPRLSFMPTLFRAL